MSSHGHGLRALSPAPRRAWSKIWPSGARTHPPRRPRERPPRVAPYHRGLPAIFSPRPGPSANLVLVTAERPVLVDAGSGSVPSDAALRAFLAEHGVAPEDLAWLALTHFHADHAGGAASLQRDHGVPVAAHASEAALVNARDPRACDARFLGFPVGPFTVQRALADGDVLEGLQVIHAPGQTPGHVAYWLPSERVAITGDLLQAGDVSWIPFAGPWAAGALER